MPWKKAEEQDNSTLQERIPWELLSDISEIEEDEGQTILHCRYISKHYFVKGGWVRIHKATYLENAYTEEQLILSHALGIPVAPDRHFFTRCGELLLFTLIFPRMPKSWKRFHLVEVGGPRSFSVSDFERYEAGVYQLEVR